MNLALIALGCIGLYSLCAALYHHGFVRYNAEDQTVSEEWIRSHIYTKGKSYDI